MLKSFKYRIYPTSNQKILIGKHFGANRFLYNLALQTKQTAYISSGTILSCFDLINQLPDLKEECPWLKEINSQSLQASIRNLDNSFTKFFKGQCDFPRFKKKKSKESFIIPQSISFRVSQLIIPKFKEGIRVILHRTLEGKIKQATISKTPSGKYFVSVLCETPQALPSKHPIISEKSIGIDLGIKNFLVTSDGEVVSHPAFLNKYQTRLKYLQRKYSKYKGKRTRHKLTLLHEKISNQRKDFLHKVSSSMISDNQTIILESLNITGMMKNHQLARSILDASWGTFIKLLEYKAEWEGVNIIRIGQFDPSSKLCSNCGYVNRELKLSDRKWTCPKCNSIHDRDLNAAINIKNFGLKNHLSVERRLENQNELPTLVGVLTSEVLN